MCCVAKPLLLTSVLLCKDSESKDLLRDTVQLRLVEAIIKEFLIKAVQMTCWKERFRRVNAASCSGASNAGALRN